MRCSTHGQEPKRDNYWYRLVYRIRHILLTTRTNWRLSSQFWGVVEQSNVRTCSSSHKTLNCDRVLFQYIAKAVCSVQPDLALVSFFKLIDGPGSRLEATDWKLKTGVMRWERTPNERGLPCAVADIEPLYWWVPSTSVYRQNIHDCIDRFTTPDVVRVRNNYSCGKCQSKFKYSIATWRYKEFQQQRPTIRRLHV